MTAGAAGLHGDLLIANARVVSMDDEIGEQRTCDILIRNGAIAAVGRNLPGLQSTKRIDATGMIAFPGLIDGHNCLWQTTIRGYVPDIWDGSYWTKLLPLRSLFTAEDNRIGTYVGACEALQYGTTTMIDYCHNIRGPGYADGSLSALDETGIRHVFTYSFMSARPDEFANEDARFEDGRRLYSEGSARGRLAGVHFGVDSVGTPDLEKQLSVVRDMGALSCIHVNNPHDIEWLNSRGLLGPDLLAIHGNLITDYELDWMAKAGMPLCFTPSVDVQGTPADVVSRATKRGIDVIYGCDVPSHVASDLLMQLRVMFHVQGYIDGAAARLLNIVHERRPRPGTVAPLFRPRDLLYAATRTAARVLGLDDVVGSISIGKAADIVLINEATFGPSTTDDVYAHILLQTSVRDIRRVLVGGREVVSDGIVLGYDAERSNRLLKASRSRLMS